jgi:hypothetical protein
LASSQSARSRSKRDQAMVPTARRAREPIANVTRHSTRSIRT